MEHARELAHIPKVVLTGGPCAGKTTAFCYLQEKLGDLGFHAFVIPETPTLLMNAGITPKGDVIPLLSFQTSVIRLMRLLEKEFRATAQNAANSGKFIMLGDRGLMDPWPYMPDGMFEQVLQKEGLTILEARDTHCEAVFHLITAADGAEEFYTLENNSARLETPEEAHKFDKETLNAWMGHPHLRVIDN